MTMPKIATVITSPTIGSASGYPSQTPQDAGKHCKACPAVYPGMMTIGNKRRTSDPSTDANTKNGNRFIAEKTDP